MNALAKLDARWAAGARVCVGLDTKIDRVPKMFRRNGDYLAFRAFNGAMIRATKDLALAYKLNFAPYIRHGFDGLRALVDTFRTIREEAPDVLTILDCKFGDALAEMNADYAHFVFEQCKVDAMTAQVYAGHDAAEGFTKYEDKLIFFLCKTSNLGGGEFQDAFIAFAGNKPLYEVVADQIEQVWNKRGNCGLVVGTTYPFTMKRIREIAPELPILAPGIGKQRGDLAATVKAGLVPDKGRLLISEGESIIYAPYKNQGRDDYTSFAKAVRQKLLDRTAEYNRLLELEAA